MRSHDSFRLAPAATLTLACTLALVACDALPAGPDAGPHDPASLTLSPTAVAGRAAFVGECAGCHATRDGFDLALFGFSDTTIIRRAVAHVDSATAQTIVDHVRSLGVRPMGRSSRPFQVPEVASDVAFALRLFGRDAWPANWDETALLNVDPAVVSAAVSFPVWSDEQSNLDWMPDGPLAASVLGGADAPARRALGAYYAAPSNTTLVRAVQALRAAANHADTGPCAQSDDGALRDPGVCFETTRWTASLGGQHALRSGLDLRQPVAGSTAIADAFWDVGQAARRGLLKNKAPVDHAEQNWVKWMYMGWVLAPGNRASVYTSSGLSRVGLPRHATFVALRSMVARPEKSHAAFADLTTTARHAPVAWLPDAYATGLSVLEERVARGWKPTSDMALSEARESLQGAARVVGLRLGSRRAESLVARTNALLAALGA